MAGLYILIFYAPSPALPEGVTIYLQMTKTALLYKAAQFFCFRP